MNITLPEHFFYKGKNGHSGKPKEYARVENGQLFLYGNIQFNKVMYALTYCLKGKVCYYCGIRCKKNVITLDHVIPRDFGGPTIPDNMVPSCRKCNQLKNNLGAEDFAHYKKLSTEKERNKFRESVYKRQEKIRYARGFSLPTEWYDESLCLDEVIVTVLLSSIPEGRKDSAIAKYYEEHHHFKQPIIVDRNGYLLVGFKTILFAKNHGIKFVPAIVLENVEKVFSQK